MDQLNLEFEQKTYRKYVLFNKIEVLALSVAVRIFTSLISFFPSINYPFPFLDREDNSTKYRSDIAVVPLIVDCLQMQDH